MPTTTSPTAAELAPLRYRYGPEADQVGDLWLPAGPGKHPVAAVIHGGCWRAFWRRGLMDALCRDLVHRGFAAWNIEYRRLGQGGGWPTTLIDVGAAVDLLDLLADRHPLDLVRVVFVGHSAGGHLALWAAGRPRLSAGEPGADPVVVPTCVLALAAMSALELCHAQGTCDHSVFEFLGGSPEDVPERYRHADPTSHLPLGIPQILVHGGADVDVDPSISGYYRDQAKAAGDDVIEVRRADADHFDVIDPSTPIWKAGIEAVSKLHGAGTRAAVAGAGGEEVGQGGG